MKAARFSHGIRSATGAARSHWVRAFTLIEIMMVVAILGIILAMGIPSILRALRKEGMRKAVNDVVEMCGNARARAVMQGQTAAIVFHPREHRLEIGGAEGASEGGGEEGAGSRPGIPVTSAQLPDNVMIEMLDINLLEYRDSDVARVRFFPNGTSDEMTLILRSDNNEWRAISLEITTGLAGVETDPQKFGK